MKENNTWFVFARDDERIAEKALEEEIYNQVCFHSQQGVEKLLKGFLRGKGKRFPKIHSLAEILGLCAQITPEFAQLEKDCLVLDKYYIVTRYPDALPGSLAEGLPDKKQAREALSILRRVREFLEKGEVDK